jgi:glycosyltransferase involved in cell wall biosynthesis
MIIDMHNVESVLCEEICNSAAQVGFQTGYCDSIRAIEADLLTWVDRVWTCTEPDRQRLVRRYAVSPEVVTVVPNVAPARPAPPPDKHRTRLLYLGRLDWFPNVQAVEFLVDKVLPELDRRGCRLPLTIAGARPVVTLRERRLPPRVQLISNPPKTEPLWDGAILAVPLRLGGGSRLKIIEAFSVGCPVISSAKGIEGIDARHGVHYLRADSASEMAAAVHRLVEEPQLTISLTAAAHRLVVDRYSPANVADAVRCDILGGLSGSYLARTPGQHN